MNNRRPRIAKGILRKKNQAGGTVLPLQTILQSYSKPSSIDTRTYGSLEQNREPRNKLTHLFSINLQQRRQDYKIEKRVSLASGGGKVGQVHVDQ